MTRRVPDPRSTSYCGWTGMFDLSSLFSGGNMRLTPESGMSDVGLITISDNETWAAADGSIV